VGGCAARPPITCAPSRRWPRDAARARFRGVREAFYSGIELVEAEDSVRPLIVGERTNVIGSRAF